MEVQAGSEDRATACNILAAGRISRSSGSHRWRLQSAVEGEGEGEGGGGGGGGGGGLICN